MNHRIAHCGCDALAPYRRRQFIRQFGSLVDGLYRMKFYRSDQLLRTTKGNRETDFRRRVLRRLAHRISASVHRSSLNPNWCVRRHAACSGSRTRRRHLPGTGAQVDQMVRQFWRVAILHGCRLMVRMHQFALFPVCASTGSKRIMDQIASCSGKPLDIRVDTILLLHRDQGSGTREFEELEAGPSCRLRSIFRKLHSTAPRMRQAMKSRQSPARALMISAMPGY